MLIRISATTSMLHLGQSSCNTKVQLDRVRVLVSQSYVIRMQDLQAGFVANHINHEQGPSSLNAYHVK